VAGGGWRVVGGGWRVEDSWCGVCTGAISPAVPHASLD